MGIPDEASFCCTREEVVYWALAWDVVAVAAVVAVVVVVAFASSFGGSFGAYEGVPSCCRSCPFGWDASCPCCFPYAYVAVVASSSAVAYY